MIASMLIVYFITIFTNRFMDFSSTYLVLVFLGILLFILAFTFFRIRQIENDKVFKIFPIWFVSFALINFAFSVYHLFPGVSRGDC